MLQIFFRKSYKNLIKDVIYKHEKRLTTTLKLSPNTLWPFLAKIGYTLIVAYPFLAQIGYTSVVESTLTADRVLFPIESYPFLAKIGHSSFGAYPFLAKIGHSPFDAYPFLARIGHSPFDAYPFLARIGHSSRRNSTITADRMLYPIEAYPFLAKIGHSPFEAYPFLAKKGHAIQLQRVFFLIIFQYLHINCVILLFFDEKSSKICVIHLKFVSLHRFSTQYRKPTSSINTNRTKWKPYELPF